MRHFHYIPIGTELLRDESQEEEEKTYFGYRVSSFKGDQAAWRKYIRGVKLGSIQNNIDFHQRPESIDAEWNNVWYVKPFKFKRKNFIVNEEISREPSVIIQAVIENKEYKPN